MSRILNIRAKMAILIVALLLIIGAAVVQTVSILASIDDRLAGLDEQTSAAFAANAVLAVSDEAMADAIGRVRLANEEEMLAELEQEFAEILDETNRALSLLPIAQGNGLRLASQLDLFAARMERLFSARRETLVSLAELDGTVSDLTILAERLNAELSTLIARRLDISAPGLSTADVISRSATRLRLQGQLDLLRGRVADFSRTEGGASRREVLIELRAQTGELVRAVASLRSSEDVGDVVESMAEIYAMVSPDERLSRVIENVEVAGTRFASALSDVNEARRATDRLTAETAEFVGASIREQRRDVFAEESDRRRGEATVFAVVVLAILLLVWWVIDRRIVLRIERLTQQMQRVAAGDLDAPVPAEVGDEIGQMAEALSVFRENAIELRRSNAELGNFAYAASHDLRSPLRAIRNLVDWTIEDAGDDLPDEIQSNLEMIRARADRLSRLLTDLLEYARAGSGNSQAEVVHLPGLVRDIAEIADPDRRFDISFTGDRCTHSAKVPLRTMLLNLVSNAIKHHDQQTGRVVVSHNTGKGRSIITVTDDGPGIPLQYQQKVFDLFQTLKSNDEVEGSGMGLAMVRKLAGELGGTIELRSPCSDERGTAFIIALPVEDIVIAEDPFGDGRVGEKGKAA